MPTTTCRLQARSLVASHHACSCYDRSIFISCFAPAAAIDHAYPCHPIATRPPNSTPSLPRGQRRAALCLAYSRPGSVLMPSSRQSRRKLEQKMIILVRIYGRIRLPHSRPSDKQPSNKYQFAKCSTSILSSQLKVG